MVRRCCHQQTLHAPAQRLVLDWFWSAFSAFFLFAHVGFLVAATGLVADTDYSGFVQHVHLARWQANLLLGLVGIVNALVIYVLLTHLIRLRRKVKAGAPQAVGGH